MTIKLAIAGARGRMGGTAILAATEAADIEIVAALDYKHDGQFLHNGSVTDTKEGIPIYTSLQALQAAHHPDVLLDVTDPDAVFTNASEALSLGMDVVIGTSGLTAEKLEDLESIALEQKKSCIIAPNFSIGAVLMMKFAQQAARYLGDVEILEMHHDRKLDAPSGTAVKTAEMIREVRAAHIQGHPEEQEKLKGARGADVEGMKIHSIRLPGLLAHQEVLLGGEGELLKIRHDSFDRKSFMPGILLAVREAVSSPKFVYGLEKIID
ncbi:4-hydroxy-tetrahydrodipicolinate reductase [Sporosarcina sp. P37]|uniref:4-hydroxy-tetrahydrodipicolinate reductase n=1 Tax=unclassified Sporosarcina TaxID=2647733 RepID=UPI0009BEA157|nr:MULTISPECIES: 4-hydroxy-tetrahydrodipicolinate reductase [unclassified Sporosarcina]ARD49469.1 4-hydroxy-tetrahydrodipicolinate reductase [Sporosarcina sp. P33]ARK25944.1 4-hydroxy-tetrahydrodipicolinate reductase [Sporosarcina sp. P37]PID18235.1 4-hydroxy-tetrahydrodipicolinate reductase [Sporosarcina sp. P35]